MGNLGETNGERMNINARGKPGNTIGNLGSTNTMVGVEQSRGYSRFIMAGWAVGLYDRKGP